MTAIGFFPGWNYLIICIRRHPWRSLSNVRELYLADITVSTLLHNESPLGLEVGQIFAAAYGVYQIGEV